MAKRLKAVEVLETLKGGAGQVYLKGTVLTSHPLPDDILKEISLGRPTVRTIFEDIPDPPPLVIPEEKVVVTPIPVKTKLDVVEIVKEDIVEHGEIKPTPVIRRRKKKS